MKGVVENSGWSKVGQASQCLKTCTKCSTADTTYVCLRLSSLLSEFEKGEGNRVEEKI